MTCSGCHTDGRGALGESGTKRERAEKNFDARQRLISLYSLRITAFNLIKEAERTGLVPVLTEDQRNKICSESHHTRFSTTETHYVQDNIVERVALRRGARLAVLTPIQSFTCFHQNKSLARSFVVGIDGDGV